MYQTDDVAILMATYNGEQYISEQIDSILTQTFAEWKLFIHDDGSSDHTVEIIREYASRYPDKIVVVEGAKTGGAKNNFFYLFSKVEAPYYMCTDQDDVWLPEKIRITRQAMLALETEHTSAPDCSNVHGANKPCLVFTDLTVVDGQLQVIAEKMSAYQGLDCQNVSFNRVLIQNVVTGCTMMANRSLRDELVKLNDYRDVLMHDWWAALVAAAFGKMAFVSEPTILYRQHGRNSVGAQNANKFGYMLKRMMQGTEIKESLENTRKQAGLFAKIYENADKTTGDVTKDLAVTVLAREYAAIGTQPKFKRWKFYKEHNIKKSTLAKNAGLWIWG